VTHWSDDATVYAQDDAGPLVAAAVARLQARAEASSEARDPTWRLDGGEDRFGLRRRGGGTLLVLASLGLFWTAGYRVARLRLSRALAVLAVAVVYGRGERVRNRRASRLPGALNERGRARLPSARSSLKETGG
jgi:hypothetical protein